MSNSVEVLFEHLKANLFSEEVDVFSERILIVPSGGIGEWIQTQLASKVGIAAGLSTVFLDKGIAKIKHHLFEPMAALPLPTHVELFLEVEAQIGEALRSSEKIWEPLVQYVQGKERRKIDLCLYLTRLFERYGTCAQNAAAKWEQNPSNWQEALWAKVYSRFDYPQRALGQPKIKKNIPSGVSAHLFAFSYICPLYFHFLRESAHHMPVYVYQLSPCQEFWSDLPSDHVSLLGSMGKMGRSMAQMIENSGALTHENYITFGGSTQLKRLQRDLLNLESTETPSDDPSIQVHLHSTRREEIIALRDYLLGRALQGEILPSDIVVMAPNIALYVPYIEAIFGRYVDYQIADMPSQSEASLIEGLFLLLDLEKKRWSARALLEFFEHPIAAKKWNFSDDDLACIKTWVKQTGIRFGFNGSHRAHLLNQATGEAVTIEEGATWMEGLKYLVEELAIPYEPTRIEFSQAETLGKTIGLLTSLYNDTRALENEMRLIEWVAFFKKLIENYFGEVETHDPLFSLFKEIEKAQGFFSNHLYRFTHLHALLHEYAHQPSRTINRNQLQAIRFCSMLPMRAIPAKIICLIGMNHDAFPRKEQMQALDLLGKHPQCGYSPSRIDFDRSLFLEALLSAREVLYISYLSVDPYTLAELPPSSVVAHLLPLISKNQIYGHPSRDFENVSIKTATISVTSASITPKGAHDISLTDWTRFSRSFLAFYLQSQGHKIKEETLIEEEETFLLTPARRALLRQRALNQLDPIDRAGDFPLGAFGNLARLQLDIEMAALPKIPLTHLMLEPFSCSVNPNLTVTFTGAIEGVFSHGICVQGKKDFRTAAKAWPLFLLLNTYDSSKSELLFAASDEIGKVFYQDPLIHLKNLIELFFYARSHPLLVAVEWIEPILRQDPKKLAQTEHYDTVLQWYLRGKEKIDADHLIETYYPVVNKAYGAMAHAWF